MDRKRQTHLRAPYDLRRRPTLAELGWTPSIRGIVIAELLFAVLCAVAYRGFHWTIDWSSVTPILPVFLAPWGLWAYFVSAPGKRELDWIIAERCLLFGVVCLFLLLHPQAQYLAYRLRRPLIDGALLSADAWLGCSLPTWVAWTAAHPIWLSVFQNCYRTLVFQLWFPLVLLGGRSTDRREARAYVVAFGLSLLVTTLSVALWPALPPVAHGLTPLLNQDHVLLQIQAVRDGSYTRMSLLDLDGLVSFPSFHIIGAVLVSWAFRHKRGLRELLIAVNLGLMAATLALGMHYLIDVIAGLVVAAGCISVSRWHSRQTVCIGSLKQPLTSSDYQLIIPPVCMV